MMLPLMVLWVISMGIEYLLALSIANAAFDRELGQAVQYVMRNVSVVNGRLRTSFAAPPEVVIRGSDDGELLYQIRNPGGEVVYGSGALPSAAREQEIDTETTFFRDEEIAGQRTRIAYRFVHLTANEDTYLIQVGETNEKRVTLAFAITGGQLSVQFLIVPMALLLVWFGLAKGIAPLNELTKRVHSRKPQDLYPIDPLDAPEEVRAFIYSINDLMSRLEQSLKVQQRFVSDAAHQLRTPIAGLKTQAELALRQRDQAGLEHTIRQIALGAKRASRLINQLLALAHADADMPPPMSRLDLVALAREVTREWVERAREKEIDLGFEGSDAPRVVEGNELLLREMLNNVIDNAIRYTNQGGRVTMRVIGDRPPSIEVEDNGMGIAAPERELVFERFYRVLGTGTEGTGLGLAIVQAIADIHRARVRLLDNPRESGTVVRIEFPYTESGIASVSVKRAA